jgi:hypothetical protein
LVPGISHGKRSGSQTIDRKIPQQITGRFYPEKEHYLVGEPIIVNFEVVNGTDKVFEMPNLMRQRESGRIRS